MYRYVFIALLAVLPFYSFADLLGEKLVKEENSCFSWIFEDYDTWRSTVEKARSNKAEDKDKLKQAMEKFDQTFGKDQFTKYKQNLACSTFKYEVDGIDVHGFYIRPLKAASDLPILVYNRGGNQNFGRVNFPRMMLDLFPIAHEGFAIIGTQYRGTQTKNTLLDEFGGADVNDVMALIDMIPSLPNIDKDRAGMYGVSRGGMQSFLTLKRTNQIKALAVIGGASDLVKELEFRPFMEKVYKRQIPNYLENKNAELTKRSVVNWVSSLPKTTPILLLHGESDKRVSVQSSITLAESLAKHEIQHKLVIYPKDSHGLYYNKDNADKEIVEWFIKHL